MKVKFIPSTWVERDGRRLDCGPYMSGALEARALLDAMAAPKESLTALCERGAGGIFHAGRETRRWVRSATAGIPFLGSTDILCVDVTGLPLMSKAQVARNPKLLVREGWTLITRTGTIGRMAYCRPDMAGHACSEHVMRVVPDTRCVPGGYIYAYLASRFGVPLVTGGTYGSIIQSIEPQHIASLPVPRLGSAAEGRIADHVEKAAGTVARGAALYCQATEQALALIGMKDVSNEEWDAAAVTSFTATADQHLRLRALSYEPRASRIAAHLRRGAHQPLGSLLSRSPFRPNRFNRVDTAEGHGVQLVGQREMFYLHWEGRWISRRGLGDASEVIPPYGTVAVACIGTLGEQEVYCRSVRVRESQTSFALSDNVLQVRVDDKKVPSGYVFALLRSNAYFRLFRSLSLGGKQQVLHPLHVAEVPIPMASVSGMREIDDMIKTADRLVDEGSALERAAIARLEAAIQGGR